MSCLRSLNGRLPDGLGHFDIMVDSSLSNKNIEVIFKTHAVSIKRLKPHQHIIINMPEGIPFKQTIIMHIVGSELGKTKHQIQIREYSPNATYEF